jgi:hypothetical protein
MLLLPRPLHSAFSSTTFPASPKTLATANKPEFLKFMGRVATTRTSYPFVVSHVFKSLGVPDTLPHCLRAQYQPAVIRAIFAYCLWGAGVLRPKDYSTFHVFNSGKSAACVPINTTVNNHPGKICTKCNCRRYCLTIRITVICSNSPLST